MEYEIVESSRAKSLRIVIHPDGRVVVTKPARMGMRAVEKWIAGKEAWIEDMRAKFQKSSESFEKKHGKPIELQKLRRGSKGYKEAVESARALARGRLEHFNQTYGFTYGTISIRNQKTRWGSCSARGNLSFNYRITLIPPELADYLVVHELCHTKEHNHSVRFWAQVARTIPDYQKKRNELHRYRF
ncbi:MAG: putative metal-dependent hydrolase [Parcubacteria group bacterium]|nr:putative metal-dependent hydrolase [Parcubacteria group bacterium]